MMIRQLQSRPRALAWASVTAATVLGLSACSGSSGGGGGGGGAGGSGATGGVLTIQGDAGNPTLVENFNPLQPGAALHGMFLIYEPLAIPSPIDGQYTYLLAAGQKFTDPKTLQFTVRQGVWTAIPSNAASGLWPSIAKMPYSPDRTKVATTGR